MTAYDDDYEHEPVGTGQSTVQDLRRGASTDDSVRPVTVRQILSATRPHSEAPYSIDGLKVQNVSIVAQLTSISHTAACVFYTIEDGTSRITVKQWHNDGQVPLQLGNLQFYVHIVGYLDIKDTFQQHNVVVVKTIHRVPDNEVAHRLFFHIAEVAFVNLSLQRGPPPISALQSASPRGREILKEPRSPFPPPSVPPTPDRAIPRIPSRRAPPPPTSLTRSTVAVDSQAVVQDTPTRKPRQNPPASPSVARAEQHITTTYTPRESRVPHTSVRSSTPDSGSPIRNPRLPIETEPSPWTPSRVESRTPTRNSGIRRDPYAHLTALQRAILLQILNSSAKEGLSAPAIVRGVSHHNATADQIGDALDYLQEHGHIETTVDDSHFAVKTNHYPSNT